MNSCLENRDLFPVDQGKVSHDPRGRGIEAGYLKTALEQLIHQFFTFSQKQPLGIPEFFHSEGRNIFYLLAVKHKKTRGNPRVKVQFFLKRKCVYSAKTSKVIST